MRYFKFLVISFYLFTQLTTCKVSYKQLLEEANTDYNEIIDTRRYLHSIAELSFKEYKTTEYIQKFLEENKVNFTTGWGYNIYDKEAGPATGVVAEIGTGQSPCVGMRADIDALPIQELADFPFKSAHEGVMHACGHDAHTTMLLEAAKLLKKHEDEINGTIKLVFQPAEEMGGGGYMVVNEGYFEKLPKVQRMSGLHISPDLPTGMIGSSEGPIMAANYNFIIFIYGMGGHAAYPHLSIDPIAPATAIVRALYDMVAREHVHTVNDVGTLSVTYFNTSSTSQSIIPNWVELRGRMWSYNKSTMNKMKIRLNEIVKSYATAQRCTYTIKNYEPNYLPLVNDNEMHELIRKLSEDSMGQFMKVERLMSSEDFSFFADVVPSEFFRLGTGSGSEIEGHLPTNTSTHSPRFALDERALPIGAAFHTYFALESLNQLS